MARKNSRIGVVLVSLAVVAGLGCEKRRPTTVAYFDHCLVLGNQTITVGPTETTLSCPIVVIGPTNTITWTGYLGQPLSICFPKSGFPKGIIVPPFERMQEVTTPAPRDDFVFPGVGNSVTNSTAVNTDLLMTAQHGQVDYAYDQILNGKRSDGRIIIMW